MRCLSWLAVVVVAVPITMPAVVVVVALFTPLHTRCLRAPASAIQLVWVAVADPLAAIPEQTGRTLYLARLHLLAVAVVRVLTTMRTTA